MRFVDIINKKKEKFELNDEEIQFWIDGIVDGSIQIIKQALCLWQLY